MIMVCGVDEAGRGPLAGSVFAAAVILDPSRPILGLKDSKKLSPKQLSSVYLDIMKCALEVSFATATPQEIDQINILQASLLAMKRAIFQLSNIPDRILIDGQHCPDIQSMEMKAVVKGDAKHQEISAASIIAKVERDKYMLELDHQFPEYNFKQHKGYPTKEHIRLIREFGVSPVHRKTFRPVSELLI